MDQNKIGKFIKSLRKSNNLTQLQLAEKYGVTYQAVSKWENGKNLPDMSLILQMSKDFNIDISEILNGKYNKIQKRSYIIMSLIISIIILSILFLIFIINRNNDYKFKVLSSNCKDFNISGSIAYNNKKSSIFISSINYCGGDDNTKYKSIECVLYENNGNIDKKIDVYKIEDNNYITLDSFLKKIDFTIDNYSSTCKSFKDNSLYLIIYATDIKDKIITYKVPLSLNDSCSYK